MLMPKTASIGILIRQLRHERAEPPQATAQPSEELAMKRADHRVTQA